MRCPIRRATSRAPEDARLAVGASASPVGSAVPPWTAMKEGLLGGTLDVSPRSESKEARLHVARWAGSESKEDRRLPAVGGGRGRRRVGLAAGRGRAAWPRRPGGHVGLAGARRDRVDERRAVRSRPPRGARVGGAHRRRDQVKGLAPLACKTDKIDARVLATLSARDLVPEIW